MDIGPAQGTGFTVLFRGACSGDGSVCGKCLDLPGGDTDNGNKVDIWDCNGR